MPPLIPPPIRILLVDDREIVLSGLKKLINGESPLMKVVGTATNVDDARRLIKEKQPNILLLKVFLNNHNCAQMILNFVKEEKTRVMVFSAEQKHETIDRAVLNGARGVVHENEKKQNILKAIKNVHAGELWIDRSTTSRIFLKHCSYVREQNPADFKTDKIVTLTPKEKLVIKAFAQLGGSAQNKQIAARLCISNSTLRNHLTSIFSKLEITNRYDLFMFAKHHSLEID